MGKPFGYHLILDCKAGENVTDGDHIRLFSTTLVNAIKMKAFGEPQVVHFAEHDPSAAGFTLVQLIETSSITAHFVDISGDFYLDVFSCCEFDPEIVLNVVDTFFSPEYINKRFIVRTVEPFINGG